MIQLLIFIVAFSLTAVIIEGVRELINKYKNNGK